MYSVSFQMSRIRGRRWMAIRAAVLANEPFCRKHQAQGIMVAATEVDHIKRLADGGIDHPSNYQALCEDCHKEKTALENSSRLEIGSDGYPAGEGRVDFL